MTQTLEQRIQRLEDIQAIRQLKHEYCYACDANYDARCLKQLFSPTATWQADGFGIYQGTDAIAAFFTEVSKKITAAAHLVLNDVINVADDGLTASGKWRNIQPVTARGDQGESQAMWMLARYDEEYVKLNGHWLIQKLVASIQFSAAYDKGWAELWPGE